MAEQPDVPLAAPALPAQVVRAGEPGFLTTQTEVRNRFDELLTATPAGSVAVVPLNADSERLGVLGVSFADERVLSETDREHLPAVGGVSGLALASQRR